MKKMIITAAFLTFSGVAYASGPHYFVGIAYDIATNQQPITKFKDTKKQLTSLRDKKIRNLPKKVYKRDGYNNSYNSLIKVKVSGFDRYKYLVGRHRVNDFLCRDHNIMYTAEETYTIINPLILKKIHLIEKEIKEGSIVITSGHRTPHYNSTLKGAAKKSRHLRGAAVDIIPVGLSKEKLLKIIKKVERQNPRLKGYKRVYKLHVHIDVR